MKMIKPKINSVCKYHGGKHFLAKDIISLFHECDVFVDATVGAGNIVLNIKTKPGRIDYAIDLDKEIITMWAILKSPFEKELKYILDHTNYNECTFQLAKLNNDNDRSLNPAVWASKYIIRNRFSRGGLGKDFAWSERLRGGKPGDVNGWENFVKNHYPRIIERVKTINFYNGCLREVLTNLRVLDNYNAVVYIDPPYVFSSRTTKSVYKHEMKTYNRDVINPDTELTHEGMWEMIKSAKCKFYVSGYDSDAYREFGAKVIFEKDIANHSGQGKSKQRRRELVWSMV